MRATKMSDTEINRIYLEYQREIQPILDFVAHIMQFSIPNKYIIDLEGNMTVIHAPHIQQKLDWCNQKIEDIQKFYNNKYFHDSN